MRTLVEYVFEVKIPDAKLDMNVNWEAKLKPELVDEMNRMKVNLNNLIDLYFQWLCDNDKATLDLLANWDNSAKPGGWDKYYAQLGNSFYKFTDEIKLARAKENTLIARKFTWLLLRACGELKPGYINTKCQSYIDSKKLQAPKHSGKIRVNRTFDKNTKLTFISAVQKYISDGANYVDKCLVYIYYEPKLRKLFESKKIDFNTAAEIAMTTFAAYDIEDRVVRETDDGIEYLSSVVGANLQKVCDVLKPKGIKALFDSADKTDDNYYIIIPDNNDLQFIQMWLIDDITRYIPGVTIKNDNNVPYGLYGPVKPTVKFGAQSVTFAKIIDFIDTLCNKYINNYKGHMPL